MLDTKLTTFDDLCTNFSSLVGSASNFESFDTKSALKWFEISEISSKIEQQFKSGENF